VGPHGDKCLGGGRSGVRHCSEPDNGDVWGAVGADDPVEDLCAKMCLEGLQALNQELYAEGVTSQQRLALVTVGNALISLWGPC
jgi:hypothetical protein